MTIDGKPCHLPGRTPHQSVIFQLYAANAAWMLACQGAEVLPRAALCPVFGRGGALLDALAFLVRIASVSDKTALSCEDTSFAAVSKPSKNKLLLRDANQFLVVGIDFFESS